MQFDLISFDLQGTLSDSRFSDEFWLELLPRLYAERHSLSPAEAKESLRQRFMEMGKYDRHFYDSEYWLNSLCPGRSFAEAMGQLQHKPLLFADTLKFIKELRQSVQLIVISTTTRSFIDVELGQHRHHFRHVYSTLDDLNVPGKPARVFEQIAALVGARPGKALHVGDCPEMDVQNATAAGWRAFHWRKDEPRAALMSGLKRMIQDGVTWS